MINKQYLGQIERDNIEQSESKRRLVVGGIVVCLLLVLGIVQIALKPDKPSESASVVRHAATVAETEETTSAIMKAKAGVDEKGREMAMAEIAKHEEIINKNWTAPDNPDRLMAVGNLYQYKLQDYYAAIDNYRSIVDGYPDHSKTPQAYVELAACYERLGDEVQARYVYEEMVGSLDPSLQRAIYAKVKLEGENVD